MESRPLLAVCRQNVRNPVPGAGRGFLHTGGRGELVPGAGRPVLHTGGSSWQIPGAQRPDCTRGDGAMRRRAGVSTPGHGQGEGPDGYKFARSADAVDVGRGRSERSEWSPARCWQSAGKMSVTRSRGQGGPFCTRDGRQILSGRREHGVDRIDINLKNTANLIVTRPIIEM